MDDLMFRAQTERLFVLFACLPELGEYAPLVEAAVQEVRRDLREGAEPLDTRLAYYAAALAGLRYRQLIAAQSALSPTYAGGVPAARSDTQPCGFAERLVFAYRRAAADLLKDGDFIFTGVG